MLRGYKHWTSKFIGAEEAMDVAPGGPGQQEDEHNDAGCVGPLGARLD